MMYLDGGVNGIWNSVSTVGKALDVVMIAAGVGVSLKSGAALRKLLNSTVGKTLTRVTKNKIITLFGSTAGGVFSAAVDIAMVITGNSIGNMLAKGIDKVDKKKGNGYVFG